MTAKALSAFPALRQLPSPIFTHGIISHLDVTKENRPVTVWGEDFWIYSAQFTLQSVSRVYQRLKFVLVGIVGVAVFADRHDIQKLPQP
jgi:hypothetical protein